LLSGRLPKQLKIVYNHGLALKSKITRPLQAPKVFPSQETAWQVIQ
jgi:hypothetical protein